MIVRKLGVRPRLIGIVLLIPLAVMGYVLMNLGVGQADVKEDIKRTRHNLSSIPLTPVDTRNIKATGETEICVFCHTPHGANEGGIESPIWNRNLNYQNNPGLYTLYDNAFSYSLEAPLNDATKPAGYSRLCLSCHDGVLAIGSVVNKPGSGLFMGATPASENTAMNPPGATIKSPGPLGSGELTGDTRVIGTILTNDHPISIGYVDLNDDPEMVDPSQIWTPENKNGYPVRLTTPKMGSVYSVQCTSCHNPHAITYPKFLRMPRFDKLVTDGVAQESAFLPDGGGGDGAAADTAVKVSAPGRGNNDTIICLACHDKPGWANSTHDKSTALHAAYPTAGNPYDFDAQHTVAEYACRNCHDPHTAQGATRIHREGVDAFGGSPAIENTCYLCHSPNTSAVSGSYLPAGDPTTGGNPRFIANGSRVAPDILSQFGKDSSGCLSAPGASPGSGMCLQLATNHQPVFTNKPHEGVQVMSQGVTVVPNGNYSPISQPEKDVLPADINRHVECVDCHNPHQVINPKLEPTRGGRFKGMKGVGIDVNGNQAIVVANCDGGKLNPLYCGGGKTDVDNRSADRDPYLYEICFRCHGNSYVNIFQPERFPDDLVDVTVPAGYTSYTKIRWSPRTDPTNGVATDAKLSFKGFSNKWREFNPYTDDIETPAMSAADLERFGQLVPSHSQQQSNPAYHPVARPGRNGSQQLCNQLRQAFGLNCADATAASTSLRNLTIQCADCHNSDKYDAYNNNGATPPTNYPNTGNPPYLGILGPLTESNRRTFLTYGDVDPNLDADVNFATERVAEVAGKPSGPIGPHGSRYRRLLRAYYDTDILTNNRCFESGNPQPACTKGDGFVAAGGAGSHQGGGTGSDNAHFQKFLLCFQCHDRAAFDPDVTTTYYGAGTTGPTDRNLTRFFGLSTSTGVDSWWEGNLHMYHLRWSGAMCHECHYNIHSNVEATNTIYGDGKGGSLPGDAFDGISDGVVGTHLINFGPTVEGTVGQKPIWFYDGTAFRCYLRCHNEVMNSCAYQAPGSGTPNARWCAGGRNPGTPG